MNAGKRALVSLLVISGAAALVTASPAFSQTRDQGPWWPNTEWGPEDQAGASNRITPAKILEALSIPSTGKTYELGHVYQAGMPLSGTRSYTQLLLPFHAPAGNNRVVFNVEFLATQIGQVGTQFDGLGHVGQEVVMDDGEPELVFYNGFTSSEMDSATGLQRLGIEHVKPIITRGIIVDVAGFKGMARLENSYEVTVDDVLGALALQGMSAGDIRPGDAILFRFGWSSLWDQPEAYNRNPPGIGLAVAQWVIERQVSMVGSDNSTEISVSPEPGLVWPVHQELMMKNGIFNLENMSLEELVTDDTSEFLLIVNPIRLRGATGSPVRTIAIR